MSAQMLKLKQASTVLQVEPKELQNLVQFCVVKPKRSNGTYYFDSSALMAAKLALYLKKSLGTRASLLSRFIGAFSACEEKLRLENPVYVVFTCRLAGNEEPMKVVVPFRAIQQHIEKRMSRAELYPDLPRGKKQRGWKKEFLKSLAKAAKEIGDLSEEEILRTVRRYRRERRVPEITVAAES
jgi:hypothetical protein